MIYQVQKFEHQTIQFIWKFSIYVSNNATLYVSIIALQEQNIWTCKWWKDLVLCYLTKTSIVSLLYSSSRPESHQSAMIKIIIKTSIFYYIYSATVLFNNSNVSLQKSLSENISYYCMNSHDDFFKTCGNLDHSDHLIPWQSPGQQRQQLAQYCLLCMAVPFTLATVDPTSNTLIHESVSNCFGTPLSKVNTSSFSNAHILSLMLIHSLITQ